MICVFVLHIRIENIDSTIPALSMNPTPKENGSSSVFLDVIKHIIATTINRTINNKSSPPNPSHLREIQGL